MSLYPPPALEADSYGTIAGVEGLVKIFTDDGVFTSDTNPSDTTVALWIDQISDSFNVALATAGFQTPIQQTDARSAIAHKVEMIVADLCNLANNTGRFFTARAREIGLSVDSAIEQEIAAWIRNNAVGFINLGVARVSSTLGEIGSKGYDKNGQRIVPIFQRDAFGNTFQDWE